MSDENNKNEFVWKYDDYLFTNTARGDQPQQPASAGLIMDHLRKMMRDIPKPSVWATGPIYVVGLPDNVRRFIDAIPAAPPSEFPGLPSGPSILAMPSNIFPDADYIFLMAGKEIAKVYMISLEEFMKRWKHDSEELAAVIERLQSY